MTTLTQWLLEQIAADEAQARLAIESRGEVAYADEPEVPDMGLAAYEDAPIPTVLIGPERVLAECEAKRRIVDLHVGEVIEMEGVIVLSICEVCHDSEMHTAAHWPCATIKAIASVYADHPDFREEWAR